MKTLYDLLGACPDDGAEKLQTAFRRAAKAHHPDLHAGDPDAPKRFRQIVSAYGILRDAEQRARYDRLLAFERKQRRAKLRRNIISDAVAGIGLAVMLIAGYMLIEHISNIPAEPANVVEAARDPVEIAALLLGAPTEAMDRKEPRDKLARAEVPGIAPVPSASAPELKGLDVAGIGDDRPAEIATVQPERIGASKRDEPRDRLARMEVPDTAIIPSVVAPKTKGDDAPANGRPAEIVAVQPAATGTADRDERPERPARVPVITMVPNAAAFDTNGDVAVEIANGGPAANSVRPATDLARIMNGFDAAIDRADAKASADDFRKSAPTGQADTKITVDEFNKNDGTEPFDQNSGRSAGARFSALEKDSGAAKSPSTFAISTDKYNIKIPGKARVAGKRQATDRAPVKQAALENGNTSQTSVENKNTAACPGSCSGQVPRLFGVGF